VPFDYYETHAWNASRTAITHRLHLDKRAGRRRQDLRFVQGENIIAVAEPQRMGDDYANTILAIGKGSGRKTLRVNVSRNDGHLRRVKVISHKRVGSRAKLTRIARRELAKHVEAFHVPMIQVKQHVNAPIGSWQMGDEILLHLHVPHLGNVTAWHRIVAEELAVDGTAMLTLTPPGL
jgi:prophage tail gpP-like protein